MTSISIQSAGKFASLSEHFGRPDAPWEKIEW